MNRCLMLLLALVIALNVSFSQSASAAAQSFLDHYCDEYYDDKGEDTIDIIISRNYYSLIQAKLSCNLASLPLRFQSMDKIRTTTLGKIRSIILKDLSLLYPEQVCFPLTAGGYRCYDISFVPYMRLESIREVYVPDEGLLIDAKDIIGIIQ